MTNHRQLQPSRWLQNWRGRWSANLGWTGTATVKSLEREEKEDGGQSVPQRPVIRLSAIPAGVIHDATPGRGLSRVRDGGHSSCFQLLRLLGTEGLADGAQSGQPLTRFESILPQESA